MTWVVNNKKEFSVLKGDRKKIVFLGIQPKPQKLV